MAYYVNKGGFRGPMEYTLLYGDGSDQPEGVA